MAAWFFTHWFEIPRTPSAIQTPYLSLRQPQLYANLSALAHANKTPIYQ
jgi:hypothetical protein